MQTFSDRCPDRDLLPDCSQCSYIATFFGGIDFFNQLWYNEFSNKRGCRRMKKNGDNTDRVDREAYERELDRLSREREVIEEMSAGGSLEEKPAISEKEE